MKLTLLKSILHLLLAIVFLACQDDSPEKEKGLLSLELDSKSIASPTVEVKNFTLKSSEIAGSSNDEYYRMEYSFEIHNKGSEPLVLMGYTLQTSMISGANDFGAGGTTLPDITIQPGGFYTVHYYSNSGAMTDPLDIDGWHLVLLIYPGGDFENPLITLDYLIHVN